MKVVRIASLVACAGMALQVSADTGVAYQHYRFKVNAVLGPNAIQLELSKIGLFCEGKELAYTYSSVSRGPATSAYGSTTPDGPSRLFWRGNPDNLYADWNGARGTGRAGVTDEDRDNCYVDVSFAEPVRIDSYAFKTGTLGWWGDGCRAPKDFQLFGSNDGESWTLLDARTGFNQPNADKTWCAPFPLGGADQGNYATDAKWFRLTIRDRSGRTDYWMSIGEFALYDANGARIDLTGVVRGTSSNLSPGEAIEMEHNLYPCYEGYIPIGTDQTVYTTTCMFDGKVGGSILTTATNTTPDKATLASSIFVSRGTRFSEYRDVCVLLRLPDSAPAVAGYNLASANASQTTFPRGWILEASYDGVTWFRLDEREDEYMTTASNWFNARPYLFNRAVPSASGATLTVGSFDRSGSAAAPASSIVKVGKGDWIQAGASPASVDVRGGSLELFPKFDAYRFKVDRVKNWSPFAKLSEVALYDGETDVTQRTAAKVSNAHPETGDSTALLVNGSTSDNYTDTYGATDNENAEHEAQREQCWVRLDYDSPVRVTSWAFWRGDSSYSANGSPNDVRIQGSRDGGTTWIDIDVRTNAAPTVNYGKAEFVRPEYVAGTASDIAVSLSNGGALKLNEATRRISSLTVDCATGGGSIDVLAPAPNGALYLNGVVGSVNDLEIPVTVGSFSGMGNFKSWTVFVNGMENTRKLAVVDGKLVLVPTGLTIVFR